MWISEIWAITQLGVIVHSLVSRKLRAVLVWYFINPVDLIIENLYRETEFRQNMFPNRRFIEMKYVSILGTYSIK